MNYAQLNNGRTPYTWLPESPTDGQQHLLKWVNYTFVQADNCWVSTQAAANPVAAKTFSIEGRTEKVAVHPLETRFDVEKNGLEHRIYVQKTIALRYGTAEEFAEYFSQLDAMLDDPDPEKVRFPEQPFDDTIEPGN